MKSDEEELSLEATQECLHYYLQVRNETRVQVHDIVMQYQNPT